ncbi:lysozyme [Ottowia sp.]|uniref:glycoside hydrolase family protein n=1 Tax=Ottowia sp. TaxID=1898956 RepID=UPI0025CBB5BF|nr:lysozyme [Ottowia sp.]
MGITDSILLGGLSALAFIAALTWSPLGRSQRQRGQGTLRVLVAALSLSAAGLVGLAVREGYADRAVVPTQGDRPTVGFGSTFNEDGTPVKPGDTTTPVRALIKAQAHLSREEAVFRTSLPGVALSQGEYDLYMDWLYQYGSGAWLKSGMRRELLAGDYRAACDAQVGSDDPNAAHGSAFGCCRKKIRQANSVQRYAVRQWPRRAVAELAKDLVDR